MRRTDLASGCVGLLLAASVSAGAVGMPMGARGSPGAGFLPFWVGAALAILSLALIARALVAERRDRADHGHDRPDRRRERSDSGEPTPHRQAFWIAGLLLAYALVLETLGYPASTFLLLIGLARALGEQSWWTTLGFSSLVTAGSYALFSLWLGVPLPAGLLAR